MGGNNEKLHPITTEKATKVEYLSGFIAVRLYATNIVVFSSYDIALNHGGYITKTTVNRMNQTAKEFDLDFHIHIEKGRMICLTSKMGLEVTENGLTLTRGIECD